MVQEIIVILFLTLAYYLMKTINFTTKGTCCRQILIELDDANRVLNVKFNGGCNGNLKGIAALITGMDADEVRKRLAGIKCGMKETSCPDQLAKALESLDD